MSVDALSSRAAVPRASGVPWAELTGVRVGIVLGAGLAVVGLARAAAVPSYAAVIVLLTGLALTAARSRR